MQNIIRAGIIERYKATPAVICAAIAAGGKRYKINGIGAAPAAAAAPVMIGALTVEAFVAIITSLIGLLATIIPLIIQYCARVKELQSAPAEVRTSTDDAPAPSDFDGFVSTITKPSTLLPILAIAVGIFLIVRD